MKMKKQNKFIMLCGLPGSGKSTLAKSLLDDNTVWLSSDKIREELYGSENEQGDGSVVFAQMEKRTCASLEMNKSVIYDATNISSKRRAAFLKNIIKYDCIKVCIVCATPYRQCIERDRLRDRVVEKSVIKRMYLNWNQPYYYEGWDEISIYYSEGAQNSAGKPESFVKDLMDYDQETPYHMETLGEHMIRVKDYVVKNGPVNANSNMAYAALVHDCGKPFTKAFKDSRGNPCSIAHYYQHQCCGAYDAMFFDYGDKTEEDIVEISCLVGLHMDPFNWKMEKTAQNYRRKWGDELFNKIMLIHEADEASSDARRY